MTTDTLSAIDKEFLAKWEKELKNRFTEKDEDFMKVFTSEPSTPPIVDPWWVPNSGRRNDHRNNRHNQHHPYERPNHRDRGYNDNRWRDNRHDGYHQQRRRYY